MDFYLLQKIQAKVLAVSMDKSFLKTQKKVATYALKTALKREIKKTQQN